MTSSILRSSRLSTTVTTGRRVPLQYPGASHFAGMSRRPGTGTSQVSWSELLTQACGTSPYWSRRLAHATCRRPSTCRSHPSTWFQLVKVWLTSFLKTRWEFRASGFVQIRLRRLDPPTDPVLSLLRLCCDLAPVAHQSTRGDYPLSEHRDAHQPVGHTLRQSRSEPIVAGPP
jgi:hypothetical protein